MAAGGSRDVTSIKWSSDELATGRPPGTFGRAPEVNMELCHWPEKKPEVTDDLRRSLAPKKALAR